MFIKFQHYACYDQLQNQEATFNSKEQTIQTIDGQVNIVKHSLYQFMNYPSIVQTLIIERIFQ